MEYIKNYYENYDEDGRLASNHGKVEFITTMKYIDKYLKPGVRILEIGAATGRYSHALARKGYRVDAVELVEHNIEIFKNNTLDGENITVTQGNAVDLSVFGDGIYDITLLLGPMYHLYTDEDRKKALSEAIRVTKKNGVVFVAYCLNEATVIGGFQHGLMREEPYSILIDPVTFKCSSTPAEIFVLYRKEEIDALISGFNVERLHYVGTDMMSRYISECIDSMDDDIYELYLRYHLSICERADCIGVSDHSLDIFRKV